MHPIKLLLLLLCILSYSILQSQTIIDIEVEKIFILNGEEVVFVREDSNRYECDLEVYELEKYSVEIKATCYEENDIGPYASVDEINIDSLYSGPIDSLMNAIQRTHLVSQENENEIINCNSINDYLIQLLTGSTDNENNNTTIESRAIRQYIIIRLNRRNYILGFMKPYSSIIEDFLLVDKHFNSRGFIDDVEHRGHAAPDQLKENSGCADIDVASTYRVLSTPKGCQLTDMYFQQKLVAKVYDSIRFNINENVIIGYNANGIDVYNHCLKKLNATPLKAAYIYSSSHLQCIDDKNRLFWLSHSGERFDTLSFNPGVVCGSGYSQNRSIHKAGNIYKQTMRFGDLGRSYRDTTDLQVDIDRIENIYYLNNSDSHGFWDYEKSKAIFPYTYYIVDHDNRHSIINISNTCFNEYGVYNTYEDLLIKERKAFSTIKNTGRPVFQNNECDYLFETIFDFSGEMILNGYKNPIILKKGGLVGYYPIMEEVKYIEGEEFYFFFAKIKRPDGKEGWLDINGNEYFE